MRRLSALTAMLCLLATPAFAQLHPGAQQIGKFGAWQAAWFADKGAKVCYMATAPVSTASAKPVKGRDKNVLLFITHWPSDNNNAVTVSTGYSYKTGTRAVIAINGREYSLTTGGGATGADPDMAWMDDNAQEVELVKDIRIGKTLTIKGTSKRGTVITDTYDLSGASDAFAAISKTCGGN
jgi:hypothetical protein